MTYEEARASLRICQDMRRACLTRIIHPETSAEEKYELWGWYDKWSEEIWSLISGEWRDEE